MSLEFDCRHRYTTTPRRRAAISAREDQPDFQLDARFAAQTPITAIFGPTGSGKSTILKIICGLLKPTAGRVAIGGRALFDSAARVNVAAHRRRAPLVFQDLALFPHMSVRQNLLYGAGRAANAAERLHRAVELLELRDLLERFPATLSGGQAQRVALGRALLSNPRLLLLDEPLSAQDAPAKWRIAKYLEGIARDWRVPMLLVSHDQAVVRRLAQDVVVLEKGSVIACGPTAATLDLTWSRSPLGFAPPLNVLRLRVDEGRPCEALIGDQRLILPTAASGDQAWVEFAANEVILARHAVAGLSVRNQLRGRVMDVVQQDPLVFVQIDAGAPIWAEITSGALRELELQKDMPITCLIKSTALRALE